jgi:hypothetical protein
MRHWEDVERFLRDSAEEDLTNRGEVASCFVAFRGEDPLLLAYLRPFPKGGYADPIIEVAALAAPLGADRMAVAMGARAWSLDDPIAPVAPEGDLRQRVVVVHGVDGAGGAPRPFGTIWPYSEEGGAVGWGPPLRSDDAEGWIPAALATMVGAARRIDVTAEDLARQAARCLWLGHDLRLAPSVEERLAVAG